MKKTLFILLLSINCFSSNEKMIGILGGMSSLTEPEDSIKKNGNFFELKGIYSFDYQNFNYDLGFGLFHNELKGSNSSKDVKIITKSLILDIDAKYKITKNVYTGPLVKVLGGTDTRFDSTEKQNSINTLLGFKAQYDFLNQENINYRLEVSVASSLENPKNNLFSIGFLIGFKEKEKLVAKMEPPFRIDESSDLKITLKSARVLFNHNSAELDSDLKKRLYNLGNYLKNNNGSWSRIKISGHTDNIGSFEYNKDLSQKRADSIKNFLIEKGVASEKIESISYSFSRPIETNETEYGRSKNRRTEIEFFGVKNRDSFNKDITKMLIEDL